MEVGGELTLGATIFDRRDTPRWRNNMEVAINVDEVAASSCLIRALMYAGRKS